MLDRISREHYKCFSQSRRDIRIEDIIDLLSTIETHGNTALHQSLEEVLIRFLEVSILHDEVMQRIGSLWATLGPNRGKNEISDRLSVLTGTPTTSLPKSLIDYLAKILGGSAVQRGRREVNYSSHFEEVLKRQLNNSIANCIRCESCGYHFIEADFNRDRRIIAQDLGGVFSANIPLERYSDRWKPAFISKTTSNGTIHNEYLTKVTLDHRVPEEGFGWSDPDNLAISCRFCNSGKMSYRRPLEALSLFAAGGVSDIPSTRPLSKLMQTTGAAVFEFFGRSCFVCLKTASEVELTIRPDPTGDGHRLRSLAPWNLLSVCYDCVNDI